MADQPQPLTAADVAALKREKAGYESRGLADRAAQVDEYLASRGYEEPKKAEDSRKQAPQGRHAPGKSTAGQPAPSSTA